MMNPKLAFTFLAMLAFALAAGAEGHGKSEEKAEVLPPQPRVVEPFQKQALPPRAADPSWLLYQDGLRLYGEKRLGEAIEAFKKAAESRAELFALCARDLDAAAETKEALKARGRLSELLRLLALRDLIPHKYDEIRTKSGGSIVSEMRLLRETSPSSPLRGLIDASLLVVEERGLARVGDSLAALKKEVEFLKSYPEAEYAIGRAYLAEGELGLAELQIRRACEMSESLESPEARYDMLYALAGVRKSKSDLKGYETTLREISDASELFAAKDEHYRGSMERTLRERGFDKFMAMYRVEQGPWVRAYSALGELYLGDGRTISTIYLAAATNAILCRSIDEIRIDEPSYAYAGLSELLSRILADREMALFAAESDLWKDLKLLGDSLAVSGYRESAREIWSAMKASPAPQPWRKRASESLSMMVSASREP
jgi:tetratricopeptide (TPR) repeat protein